MPVNAPVEFYLAKEKYEKARTLEEKISALEEMLSTCPDHKGAEKLRMQLKRKLSKLKAQLEKQKTSIFI